MNSQGRPTRPEAAESVRRGTFTGNRALDMEEPLIFEGGRFDATGVDVEDPPALDSRLGPNASASAPDLPGLTEPEAMRHYVRLSRDNYSIDAGLYPLGSCTMKHNPRLNEKMARLPGFSDVHPLQPISTAQGALMVIEALAGALITLTGMSALAMSPKAGAHGELCGMMAIKAAIEARGETADAARGAGARFGARNQSRNSRSNRLLGASGAGWRRWQRQRRSRASGARAGRRRDHADQSEHLRPLRAPDRRDRRGGAGGGRVLLLRRREFQRDRRQGAAGRSRRRRHAHQPAQDVLHAPRRRRTGRRPGRAFGAARALRAGPVRHARRRKPSPRRARRGNGLVRPHERVPWPDGDVRPGVEPLFCRMGRTVCGRRPRTRSCRRTTSAHR